MHPKQKTQTPSINRSKTLRKPKGIAKHTQKSVRLKASTIAHLVILFGQMIVMTEPLHKIIL